MPNDTAALPAINTNEVGQDILQIRRDLSPSLRIMLDERLFTQVKVLAGIMSRDTTFTPKHLQGKAEACFTVITMAVNWNADPQFVARCTYQTPGGSIGFAGKLIQAVLEQSGKFVGAPKASYVGDWSRVLSKFTEGVSQKGNKYLKPTWTKDDAEGLGIIISWQVKGEAEPRVWPGEDEPFYLTQCFPLNSTLWATDPRTQIRYLAMRRFADGAAPGILGGASFDFDELIDASEKMRDVTPPPRPTREDFAPKVTDVAEEEDQSQPLPFEVADLVGNISEYESAEVAAEAYRAALDEGEKQKGESGLTAVWDNNQALMQALDERGEPDLSRELGREYGARREAAAAAGTDNTDNSTPTESADRDEAFWKQEVLTITAASDKEFMAQIERRAAEARAPVEIESLRDGCGDRIDALGKTDKAKVLGLLVDREKSLKPATGK